MGRKKYSKELKARIALHTSTPKISVGIDRHTIRNKDFSLYIMSVFNLNFLTIIYTFTPSKFKKWILGKLNT